MNFSFVDCFIEMKKKLIKVLSNSQNLNLKVSELVQFKAIKIMSMYKASIKFHNNEFNYIEISSNYQKEQFQNISQ